MIISRAPLRISFVGGGTDLSLFYTKYPGRVLSVTIDKYVYIAINPAEFDNKFVLKYNQTEVAKHPSEFKHDRFKEALLKAGVSKGVELASFADLPSKTGLGSSSSFSVALMKGLQTYLGNKISKESAASLACELEIDILKEPIGKQDQYAAAYGGFNVIQFNQDGSVGVEPLFVDYALKAKLEEYSLLYFTGITRSASSVLEEQSKKIEQNFETYKKMSDSVLEFKELLLSGDVEGMARMLNEGWQRKKSLASNVSATNIDILMEAALQAGALGGKVLGAGGGGCLYLIAPPEKHSAVRNVLDQKSKELGLSDSKDIHFNFTQSGVDVLFNSQSK